MTDGPLPEREMRQAILGLAGATTAAADQAQSMTDAELGQMLLTGRWTTIEIHQAGSRLRSRSAELQVLADAFARVVAWMRDPEAMETEAEMAEVADAALFRAEGVLERG